MSVGPDAYIHTRTIQTTAACRYMLECYAKGHGVRDVTNGLMDVRACVRLGVCVCDWIQKEVLTE